METNIDKMDADSIPEVIAPEEAHHDLGPSNYTWWNECPCYAGIKGMTSPMAIRGTYAHLVVQSDLQMNPLLIEQAERPAIVETEDVETGKWGARTIRDLSSGRPISSEYKVRFNDALAEELPLLKAVFGTVDAFFEDEFGQLHICDFKTFDRGDKDHTPQMSGYAVLVCSNFPQYIGKPIYMHVIAGGSRSVITYMTNFESAVKMIVGIITSHMDPSAEPRPGDCCRYCAKAKTCKAITNVVAIAATAPECGKRMVVWSDLHMADQMVLIEALKKLIKNFEADFKDKISKEKKIENKDSGVCWELTLKNPNRVLTSVSDLAVELEKHNVSSDTFVEHVCSVSQKAAVSALMASNGNMTESQAKKVIEPFWQLPKNAKQTESYKRTA